MHLFTDCPTLFWRLGLVHAGAELLALVLTEQGDMLATAHAGMRSSMGLHAHVLGVPAVPGIGSRVMGVVVVMAVALMSRMLRAIDCTLRRCPGGGRAGGCNGHSRLRQGERRRRQQQAASGQAAQQGRSVGYQSGLVGALRNNHNLLFFKDIFHFRLMRWGLMWLDCAGWSAASGEGWVEVVSAC
jgi:hypothetical protein